MSEQEQKSDLPEQAANIALRKRRWMKWAVEAIIIVVIIAGARWWQQRHMVNGPAPVLQGSLLTGGNFNLTAHPEQPILVHFWATWCPVCRAEQGTISNISKDHHIITVALWSKDLGEVKQYIADQHLEFPVIYDADSSIAKAWGVSAVPASFIVDRNGIIRFREVGYTSEWGMRLRLWLADKL